MSKIGTKIIEIPAGVTVNVDGKKVSVKGTEGELNFELPRTITVVSENNSLRVERANEEKNSKSLHGLYRQLIANAVAGVQKPWERRLEIVGTGFNVKQQGEDLVFKVGYSHQVIFKKVENIKYKVEGNNKVVVTGADKQLVGQVSHKIKMIRKPDPYKGKGIKYEGEHQKLKPGKKAKTAGA